MRWVYTDKAEIKNEENFLVNLVKAANSYKLTDLRGRYAMTLKIVLFSYANAVNTKLTIYMHFVHGES